MQTIYLKGEEANDLLGNVLKDKTKARLALYIMGDGFNMDFIYPSTMTVNDITKDLNSAGIDIEGEIVSECLEDYGDGELVIEISDGDLIQLFESALNAKVENFYHICPSGDETQDVLNDSLGYNAEDIREIEVNSPCWRTDPDSAKRIALLLN